MPGRSDSCYSLPPVFARRAASTTWKVLLLVVYNVVAGFRISTALIVVPSRIRPILAVGRLHHPVPKTSAGPFAHHASRSIPVLARARRSFSAERSLGTTTRMDSSLLELDSDSMLPAMSTPLPPLAWNNLSSTSQVLLQTKCVLPLERDDAITEEKDTNSGSSNSRPISLPTVYKGSAGRIGVLGGSADYTGAPYYASMASLQTGAELAYVFCAKEASGPIKAYSPELMVTSVYEAAVFDEHECDLQVGEWEKDATRNKLIGDMVAKVTYFAYKLHCLIVGPGLGQCPLVMEATVRIIQDLQTRGIPIVMDADALFLLTIPAHRQALFPATASSMSRMVVLTPNAMEWNRLHESGFFDHIRNLSSQERPKMVVVQKGKQDQILSFSKKADEEGEASLVLTCNEEGGRKRSGGIGDVLAGTVGTLLAWQSLLAKGKQSEKDHPSDIIVSLQWSCWMACCIVKKATKEAFEKRKRSMTAPDILKELGGPVSTITGDD